MTHFPMMECSQVTDANTKAFYDKITTAFIGVNQYTDAIKLEIDSL